MGFFVLHVLEVLGDESAKAQVQPAQRAGIARQRVDHAFQFVDRRFVLDMFVLDPLAGARGACRDRGMHEGVLVVQVVTAYGEQRAQLLAHLGEFGGIVHVEPSGSHQGVGHEGAQTLVDEGVGVVAGGVHRISPGVMPHEACR